MIGPVIATQGRAAADILKDAETWIEDAMERIKQTQKHID